MIAVNIQMNNGWPGKNSFVTTKAFFITMFIVLFTTKTTVRAQQADIPAIRTRWLAAQDDRVKYFIADSLAMYYLNYSPFSDSSWAFIQRSVALANQLGDKNLLILADDRLAMYYAYNSKHDSCAIIFQQGLALAKKYRVFAYLSGLYYAMGVTYDHLGDYEGHSACIKDALAFLPNNADPFFDMKTLVYEAVAHSYINKGQMDSAYYYLQVAGTYAKQSKCPVACNGVAWSFAGYYIRVKNYPRADSALTAAIAACERVGDYCWRNVIECGFTISLFEQQRYQDAIARGRQALYFSHLVNDKTYEAVADDMMYKCFESLHQPDSALHYLKMSLLISGNVSSSAVNNKIKALGFAAQMRERQEKANIALLQEQNTNRQRQIALAFSILVVVVIVIFVSTNNIKQKRANRLLGKQKEETQQALIKLQAAQAQLIQAEKMASLGELTAGIAHEIQNPLNFVNNFSEVSRELIAEMRDEMEAGNNNNALAIANDVEQNLEKINHHGKRADAIVKGMLQHSRKSAGQKDQTNLNNLTDEYLRLAYQGFRAKEKSFSAELVTHFGVNLPLINVIPQDIGRVCLNLFNNAFYAVQQKQKTANADNQPEVAVTTYAKNGHVVIEVKDNGTGIPDAIKDKIFQPFFTTKPTGSGTGLGLSLSYDIVKAHGGEIKVETKEGEGTKFIITLPAV